jgi:putative ABC transport system ATP-binding protein
MLVLLSACGGVNLEVHRGTFVAIVGPAGSAKSALPHRPDQVRAGFVFQRSNLLPTLSVRENILLPLAVAGRTPDPAWFTTVVGATGLRDLLRHRPGQLSGGQQQRVACARALISKPDVIFADEPTANLDSRAGAGVLTLLRTLVHDHQQTVVMATRDPSAADYADRVVTLADELLVS